jgi:hypothetical protein
LKQSRRLKSIAVFAVAALFTMAFSKTLEAQQQAIILPPGDSGMVGSVYVPLDNWVYPAFSRLEALGYADTAFQGLRPWTRLTCLHILQETQTKLETSPDSPGNREARELFNTLAEEFEGDVTTVSTRDSNT